jgi:PAT family beta-lactamase induction signal transducer AmpG
MVKPFWVDRGFSNEEIAAVSGVLGMLATIAGGWTGGGVVARLGIGRSLWVIGAFALASNLVYALAAALPSAGHAGVYAASLTESFCGGMAGVAFMSFLMRICQKEHAAVQYALLTAIYNLAGSLLRIPSGALAEALGYAGYFALTAAFALPAFAFLPGARRWLRPGAPASR